MKKSSGLVVMSVILVPLAAVGAGGIYYSATLNENSLMHHLVRDFGIACLISALVTGAYELYIRQRIDLEKIESILSTVAGSNIPPRVWRKIQGSLLTRSIMRTRAELRFWVSEPEFLPRGNFAIRNELAYDFVNLSVDSEELTAKHVLDSHIGTVAYHLPRFESISIGPLLYAIPTGQADAWTSDDHRVKTVDGELHFKVPCAPGADPVRVCVRRTEMRQSPGTYYLVMTEVTDGLRVVLEDACHSVRLRLLLPDANSTTKCNEGFGEKRSDLRH